MSTETPIQEEVIPVKKRQTKKKPAIENDMQEVKEETPIEEQKEVEAPKQLSMTEMLYAQIQEPETAANLAVSAKNLAYRFNNNWFSVSQIVKKTNIKEPQVAAQLMMMLELAGHAQKRERETGGYLYKIQLSKELQLAELKKQADEMLVQHKLILEAIDRIENPQAYEKAPEEIQQVESL